MFFSGSMCCKCVWGIIGIEHRSTFQGGLSVWNKKGTTPVAKFEREFFKQRNYLIHVQWWMPNLKRLITKGWRLRPLCLETSSFESSLHAKHLIINSLKDCKLFFGLAHAITRIEYGTLIIKSIPIASMGLVYLPTCGWLFMVHVGT